MMRNGPRRFVADLLGAYADGVRVVLALPWLFGAIVVWEFAQHVMEWRIGFFDSREAAKAVSQDGSRMALGWVKMILVYVGGFFAIRYLVLGDARTAMRPQVRTIAAYAPYIAYSLLVFAAMFYAGTFVSPANIMTVRGCLGIGQLLIEPLLMVWVVSAATDGPIRTPLQGARRMGGMYLWAFPAFFIGRLPIGAVHQFLGTYPIGKATPMMWPILAIDAIMVGLLIAIIPAIYVRCVRRVDDRRPLTPAVAAGPR